MRPGTADLLPGRTSRSTTPPHLLPWAAAIAAAEAIGIAAVAGVARTVGSWSAEPGQRGTLAVGLLLVVGAGLVEGLALGAAQSWSLGRWLPRLRRSRYVVATVLVAGLGWAAGSAPAVLGQDGAGEEAAGPSLVLLVLGAAGVGLAVGPVLGLAQAWVLRPVVRHAGAWVVANTLAWPVVMTVIFVGASLARAEWTMAAVVAAGAVTGAAAGGVLGLTTWWALRSMATVPVWDRALLRLLASTWGWLDGDLVGLEVRGRRSGRTYRMPLQYAVDVEGALVVVPRGDAGWWRNVHRPSTAVEVLWQGEWRPARAEPLTPGHPDHEEAWSTYAMRWPRAHLPTSGTVVRVRAADGNAT